MTAATPMRNPATDPATLVVRKAPMMTADQPLVPDPREAVALGSYLDLAIWLLGRNPLVADLANRIPRAVTTGPRALSTTRPGLHSRFARAAG